MNLKLLSLTSLTIFTVNVSLADVNKDAEIAQAVIAIDQNEIDAGKLALERTVNPVVKEFANMMISEHTSDQGAYNSAAASSPQKSKLVGEIKGSGQIVAKKLSYLKGREFDKEYAKAMVSGHEDVVNRLENFTTTVKDADLREKLSATKNHVLEHLKKAKELVSKV